LDNSTTSDSCTRYKSVMQRWPDSIAKGAEFALPVAK
jgi:malonate-semialdehyde dehydrogenase (acetylating) / methylmalonate-semialdehyde dehydrogenase